MSLSLAKLHARHPYARPVVLGRGKCCYRDHLAIGKLWIKKQAYNSGNAPVIKLQA